jgi:hypothetical protein
MTKNKSGREHKEMKRHHPSIFWNLFIAAALAASLLFSEQGGVMRVEASSDSAEMKASVNQAASSLETVTYNDTDKAWSYTGKWTTTRFRNAYRGEAHISTATGDHATISISGSNFTLLYGVHKKYGKLDVFIDNVKIQTIDQNNPRQLQKKEWKSPELGAGTHLVKFVHASGEMVSIDAVKVTASTTVSAPSSDSVSVASPTPTSVVTLESSPTVPPTLTEVPTLAVIPSATASIPPTEIPTLTVLPSPTASPIPLGLPTLPPSPSPSSVPTIQPATPTASPTIPPPQLLVQTASTTATVSPTPTYTPAITSTAAQIFYVDGKNGSDSNPGTSAAPFKTIQQAVNTAKAGSIIRVAAGNYPEVVRLRYVDGISLIADGKVVAKAILVETNNNLVRGFTLTDKDSKAGIRVYGNNNLVENNEIFDTAEDGMWLWGKNNVIRGNYIHDIYDDRNWPAYDQHVDCFMTWVWNWEVDNLIIENNICNLNRQHGSNQIFILTHNGSIPIRNITIRNNIFITADTGYVPIAFYGDASNTGMKIYNNTFYNTSGQGANPIYLDGMPNVLVANNVSIGYTGSMVKSVNSTVTEQNSVTRPPYGMRNIERLDFHLLAGSPLIDAGAIINNPFDFDGVARPQGNGIDIGAFEFSMP